METAFEYDDPENHVERRTRLSPAMRERLIDLPRDAWADDPRFRGEPAFWLQVHESLLGAAAELPARCERLLAAGESGEEEVSTLLPATAALAARLVRHAHTHHHVEDHHFFPLFARTEPRLGDHLALLDGDHRVLSDVLDEMESATGAMPGRLGDDRRARRDALLGQTERLLAAAVRFDSLFRRHIGDEEEICIPILLRD